MKDPMIIFLGERGKILYKYILVSTIPLWQNGNCVLCAFIKVIEGAIWESQKSTANHILLSSIPPQISFLFFFINILSWTILGMAYNLSTNSLCTINGIMVACCFLLDRYKGLTWVGRELCIDMGRPQNNHHFQFWQILWLYKKPNPTQNLNFHVSWSIWMEKIFHGCQIPGIFSTILYIRESLFCQLNPVSLKHT